MTTLPCMRIHDAVEVEAVDEQPLSLSAFVGTWHNTNAHSRGVVKIVIHECEGTLKVRVFGAADGAPIDWGEVDALQIYGKSIQSQEGATFRATYDFGFQTTDIGAIVNQGLLVVAFHSTFTDDSGRHNYFNREFFYK